MHIHGKIDNSTVNGPGNRSVIWLQGCTLACAGCWNQETHEHGSNQLMDVGTLVNWVSTFDSIEGVTISGGEPMQQAPDLQALLAGIRKARPYLTLGMFTGYTEKELEEGKFAWWDSGAMIPGNRSLWRRVREHLDFAVMGRYNQQLKTSSQPMCGSTNQELRLFSSFYKMEDFEPQSVEVIISPDGKLVQITGFPASAGALALELCA